MQKEFFLQAVSPSAALDEKTACPKTLSTAWVSTSYIAVPDCWGDKLASYIQVYVSLIFALAVVITGKVTKLSAAASQPRLAHS